MTVLHSGTTKAYSNNFNLAFGPAATTGEKKGAKKSKAAPKAKKVGKKNAKKS